VNRAIANASSAQALNVHRMVLLGLNVGLWTLIAMIGRALYA
jgi:hypothetical protein